MSIIKKSFGSLNGKSIDLYELSNNSITRFEVLSYGGILKSIYVKDINSNEEDVITGFDTLEGYLNTSGYPGAIIGRYGNRIARGRFSIDDNHYELFQNDGRNSLHGGEFGFNTKIWDVKENDGEEPSLTLNYLSCDGEEGYPGNLNVYVTYKLLKNGAIEINYKATTDKPTTVNLTNHSYFNLNGYKNTGIGDHKLWLDSSLINDVDDELIPTGDILNISGTDYDFTNSKAISTGFNSDFYGLDKTHGYDHNFVINNYDGNIKKIATLHDTKSGRAMDVFTNQPCVQVYSANMINENDPHFKGDIPQYKHCAVCLETQKMPDSVNHPHFTDTLLYPGEEYNYTTTFHFYNK